MILTIYLAGGLEHFLFFHIGNSHRYWLIFFRWGETTNPLLCDMLTGCLENHIKINSCVRVKRNWQTAFRPQNRNWQISCFVELCGSQAQEVLQRLPLRWVWKLSAPFWLVVWNMTFIFLYIGHDYPNWLIMTNIFQRSRYTTNQIIYTFGVNGNLYSMDWFKDKFTGHHLICSMKY